MLTLSRYRKINKNNLNFDPHNKIMLDITRRPKTRQAIRGPDMSPNKLLK